MLEEHVSTPCPETGTLAGVAPTRRELAAGSVLFRQNERTFGVFRLLTGRIVLLRVAPDGAEIPVHGVRPGELFAEASLFSPHYHCDARAVCDSTVLLYPGAALKRRLRADPEALWEFSAGLARRLQGLRTHMEVRQTRPASARVLQFLHLNCGADGRWQVDGTLKQLAAELGMTHEALYRALAALVREGRISRIGNTISVRPEEGPPRA